MTKTDKNKLTSSKKLFLLITIIKKSKTEYFLDLISTCKANMQMVCIGNGTTKSAIFSDEIGSKGVIFSILTEGNLKIALAKLTDKFEEIRDGKGVAWSMPLDSVMGVTLFNFLSDNKSQFD